MKTSLVSKFFKLVYFTFGILAGLFGGLLLSVYIHLSEVGAEMGGVYVALIFSMFVGAILMIRAPYSLKNIDAKWVSALRIAVIIPIALFVYNTASTVSSENDGLLFKIGVLVFLSGVTVLIVAMKSIRAKYMRLSKINS